MERKTPERRHGFDAVEAAVEERELRERIDETDASFNEPGHYDQDVTARLAGERARRAAETDVYTSDEALEDVAGQVGIELPDPADDEHERG